MIELDMERKRDWGCIDIKELNEKEILDRTKGAGMRERERERERER
jgi:hypothetical protein